MQKQPFKKERRPKVFLSESSSLFPETTSYGQTFNSISEFHIFKHKPLGNGSFGQVFLAMHIKTSKLYAIKTESMSETEFEFIQKENRIHFNLDHPHIIKLWDVFIEEHSQDIHDRNANLSPGKILCMVMDYAQKGTLFSYQNTKEALTEDEAFKYFYQTLEARSESNLILKQPENLLLDSDLNIKLCDFGWATGNCHSGSETTLCGTFEYMAPEMIFEKEYNNKIDLWSLGVLLFELLHGYAPFKGQSINEVKHKMKIGNYLIKPSVSIECRELIIALLKFEPDERITLEEIYNHPWIFKISQSLIESFQNQNFHYISTKSETYVNSPHYSSIGLPPCDEKGQQHASISAFTTSHTNPVNLHKKNISSLTFSETENRDFELKGNRVNRCEKGKEGHRAGINKIFQEGNPYAQFDGFIDNYLKSIKSKKECAMIRTENNGDNEKIELRKHELCFTHSKNKNNELQETKSGSLNRAKSKESKEGLFEVCFPSQRCKTMEGNNFAKNKNFKSFNHGKLQKESYIKKEHRLTETKNPKDFSSNLTGLRRRSQKHIISTLDFEDFDNVPFNKSKTKSKSKEKSKEKIKHRNKKQLKTHVKNVASQPSLPFENRRNEQKEREKRIEAKN